jgi:hypothetical protein
MVVVIVMIMFVSFALMEVGICIFSNNTLTFNIRIINHWWYIHTSSVEDTVYLVLPHTITVITTGCQTDLLDDWSTTVAMTVMMMVTMPVTVSVTSVSMSINVTNFGSIVSSFPSVVMAMSVTMTMSVTVTMMVTVAMCKMITIVNTN